ncbi:hypothetical protein Agub_g4214 [Astrephomene gubernaculifera]|uniref:LOV domain-containing protein n=1 Tax=Astrephomene gubernaculifera TaxID=47775 RepID=A0AAD3DJV6_9CHLO|nr:hypothetical protein Agub_g4214 [Astrephomene gubernaculifera]
MSGKQRQAVKVKKVDKREERRENLVEEPIDEDAHPWKNVVRPISSQPPKDNNFTLDDEVASAAIENLLSSFTVSDPNEEGNPLCYVSPGFLSMTGYSEQECLGRNCSFLQSGKCDPAALQALRASVAERRFTATELTNFRKDGRPFQNYLSLSPVLSSDGSTLLHMVGVQCDVDERRRRGEVVDEAFYSKWQEQLKHCLTAFALVDVSSAGPGGSTAAATPTTPTAATGGGAAARSGLASAGSNAGVGAAGSAGGAGGNASQGSAPSPPTAGAVCAVSPGFTALTGYSQSDVLGWNILSLCGPDSSERDMRKLLTSQWSHTPTAVKLLCYKRDGTPFWAYVLSCPLVTNGPAGGAAAGGGFGQGSSASRMSMGPMGPTTSGRQAQGGNGGRACGLGLGFGGLIGAAAAAGGGSGSLSSSTVGLPQSGLASAASGSLGSVGLPSVKYCLCCVVDITAQRLKKVVGGKYVLGKTIGAGAFGLVRIGKNIMTDELVAIKSVDASRFRSIAEIDQIQEEMSVLSSLKHPNIIRLFDVHFQNNTFFLVMEFAGGGSLVHFMRTHGDPVRHCLDEATAGRVFTQMVSALDYCHRRRVIHRDLKPENILMDENNNLKIADFGLAAVAAPFSGGLTLQCGTPEFTAPEITIGREYDGCSVDIWSMGVILYEALSGNLPFKGTTQATLFKAIQRGVFDPLPTHVSAECKDLVRRMLVVDPSSRISMDEILRHPWVVKAAAAGGRHSGTAAGALPSTASCEGSGSPDAFRVTSPVAGSGARASNTGFGGAGGGPDDGPGGWGAASSPTQRGSDGSDPLLSSAAPLGYLSQSRPASSGTALGGGAGQGPGPPSPSAAGAVLPGLGHANSTGPGGLHDSVKLVIPSGADRDDPVLAAILRSSHAHADSGSQGQSPSRSAADDGEEGDLRVQSSTISYNPAGLAGGMGSGGAGVSRRDTMASACSSRMGVASRSMGGVQPGVGGNLPGHGQAGSGKARGGALLPTLGAASSPGLNAVLDRRMQDPSRFRSPARVQGGAAGPAGRGGMPGARGQQGSQQGAQPPQGHASTDGVNRQLPPIQQAGRPIGKKSSWMIGP